MKEGEGSGDAGGLKKTGRKIRATGEERE